MNMMTVDPCFIHQKLQVCIDARSCHLRELEEAEIRKQAKLAQKEEGNKWRMLRGTNREGKRVNKRGESVVHCESVLNRDVVKALGSVNDVEGSASDGGVIKTMVSRSKSLRILQSLQSFSSDIAEEEHDDRNCTHEFAGATTRPSQSLISGSVKWVSHMLSSSFNNDTSPNDTSKGSKQHGVSERTENSDQPVAEEETDVMARFMKRKESVRREDSLSFLDRASASSGGISRHPRPSSAPVRATSQGHRSNVDGVDNHDMTKGDFATEPSVSLGPTEEGPHEHISTKRSLYKAHSSKQGSDSTVDISRPKSAGHSVRDKRRGPVSRLRSSAFNGVAYEQRSASTNAVFVNKTVNILTPQDACDNRVGKTVTFTVEDHLHPVTARSAISEAHRSRLSIDTQCTPPASDKPATAVVPRPVPTHIAPTTCGRNRRTKSVKEEKRLKKYPHLFLTSDGFLPFGPPKEEYGEWTGVQRQSSDKIRPEIRKAPDAVRRPIKGRRLQPLVSGRPVFKPF